MFAPADPLSPGKKLRTKPLHTPAAAKLAGPPQPRPLHFLNSKATQAGRVTPYLHGDSGAAIPTATPASPAPGRETKTPGQYHRHPLRRRGGGGTEWGQEPKQAHAIPEPLPPPPPAAPLSRLHGLFPVLHDDAISVRKLTTSAGSGAAWSAAAAVQAHVTAMPGAPGLSPE